MGQSGLNPLPKRKGQSSVELLVIVAIGLSALLAFFALSQDKLAETRTALALAEAKETVELLAKAADTVYSEGVNSTRKVYVTIPEGTNFTRSSISGKTLLLSLRVPGGYTDVSARTEGAVFGSWPIAPGSYYLTVTSYEGTVGVGTSILQISPTALYVEMRSDSSVQRNVSIVNFGQNPLSVSGTLSWSEIDATFENLTILDFPLASGEGKNLTFEINSSFNAIGTFSGLLELSAGGEEYSIPLTVHVPGASGASGGTANVSYIVVETFKEASCSTEKLIFEGPANTTIYGTGWPIGATLNYGIHNSTGQVASGTAVVNSTGGVSIVWSPAGRPSGTYSANFTDPISSNSMRGAFFSVGAC